MNTIKKQVLSSSFTPLVCLLAATSPMSAAIAQEVADANNLLEEVIVTASRREQNIVDVPSSMSLIDTESFVESGINDINALADFVPGLQAVDGGSPSLGGVNIRGINLGGSITVGIYVDDVNYGPVVGGAGTSLALDGTQFDLQNVEVVRGPQGTLYGAGAVGGVIRYKTRDPSLDEFEGYFSADLSNTQYGDLNHLFRGRISVPIIEDVLAVSFSGFYEDADGYIDADPNTPNQPEAGKKNVNGHEFRGGQLSVLYTPTDELKIKLMAIKNESEFSETGYIPVSDDGGRILPERTTATFIGPRVNEYDMYSLAIDYDFGWATFTSVTSDQEMFFDNAFDLTNSASPFPGFTYAQATDLVTLSAPGTTTNVLFNSTITTDRFAQELRLTSADSDVFEWIVGLYYTDQDSFNIAGIKATPAFNWLDQIGPTNYKEQAAFANGTYYFSADTDVTLGIRYSDNEGTVDQLFDGFLFGGPFEFPTGEEENTVATYLINVRHRPNENTALYARAASGFRPGGPNLFSDYEPDELWTYEGGIKGDLWDGSVSYDLSVFYTIWEDAQVSISEGGLGATDNAQDEITIKGLEFFALARPTDNWRITTAFSYNDSEFDGDESALGAVSGESLAGTPDVTLTVAADYLFKLFDGEASVGANWRHVGDFDTGYSNSLATLNIPNIKNDSYNVFDLRAGVDFEDYSVGLYVTNISNADDFQTIFASDRLAVQLRPRTVGVNFRYNF